MSQTLCVVAGAGRSAVRMSMFGWGFLLAIILTPMVACTADDEEDFRFQIFVGNADGSNLKRLVELPDYHSQGSPCWSGDGKKIAFDAWKSQKGERFSNGHLFVVNADGSDPKDLGPGNIPSLSPKGHRVAFARQPINGQGGIWIMDVEDPESAAQLDQQGWGVEWSPDGTRVAYAKGNNIYVYSLIEGTIEPLFDASAPDYNHIYWNFSWSSDSRRIAFKALSKQGTPVLAIVDARGSDFGTEVVFEGDIQPALTWHPNQKEILVTMNDPDRAEYPRLFRIDLEGDKLPALLPFQPTNRKLGDPSFSPDGKRLAVLAFKRD